VNVLARQAGARVVLAISRGQPASRVGEPRPRGPIGPAQTNIAAGPAMTREQRSGPSKPERTLAEEALDGGADLLATGEMGSATRRWERHRGGHHGAAAERVTGRGTGVDDATLARKVAVVRQALESTGPTASDGLTCSRRSAASRSVASSA